jgi:hypothetical protein
VGGRLRQVEHQAFVTLFAAREGVGVLPVLAAGTAEGRDALLVIDTEGSRSLGASSSTPSSSGVEEQLVLDLWAEVQRLHGIGIAHGSLDAGRIALTPDGTVALADFSRAVVAASDQVLFAERAQVLVTTALLVGPDRAVVLAVDALGTERVAASLPYLQPAALDRTTRHAVRTASWSVDDLRGMAAAAAGVEDPELEQLRRVTIGSVATVAIIALVAYISR